MDLEAMQDCSQNTYSLSCDQTRQGYVMAGVFMESPMLFRFVLKEFSECWVDEFLCLFCVFGEKISNDKDKLYKTSIECFLYVHCHTKFGISISLGFAI